jgi:hypothetical protein
MGTGDMGTNTKTRRIVDALDDLTAQLRLANQIAALGLGAAALENDAGARTTTDTAKARLQRRNELRADIRAGLGLEGEQS